MRLLGTLAGLFMLLGSGSALRTVDVRAQSAPPTRVFGEVTVNGQTPPVGTPIEAFIDGKRCGSGDVRELGEPIGVGFLIDVDADAFNPGCGNDGETVNFTVGGVEAAETAAFQTGTFVRLDLTASGQLATPTPSPTPVPGAPSTPAPTATPSPAATPSPGTSPSPAASPTATGSPDASPTTTATPNGTATPTGTPTATSTATSSPTSTATPTVAATTVRPEDEGSDDGDGNNAVIIVAIVAAIIAAGGGAYLAYLRYRRGPPA